MLTKSETLLLDLLQSQPGWSAALQDRLLSVWSNERRDGEELAEWLVREQILAPEAPRTLTFVRRGFLSAPDVSALFRDGGWERLLSRLDPSASPRVEPDETVSGQVSSSSTVRLRPIFEQPPKTTAYAIEVAPGTAPAARPSQPDLFLHQTPIVSGISPQPAKSATAAELTRQSSEVRIGSTLGKCLLTELIGKGGCGTVYRALHQSLNITVAVKVLNASALTKDPVVLERLQAEATLLAQLNHPNIIRVFDFDAGPVPYLVLEHVEGLNLADLIQQCGGLRLRRAVQLVLQTAEALAAAWQFGIVHRDVKPGNVLVTRNSVAKLADLGLAVTTQSGALARGGLPPHGEGLPAGTAAYMSPEQIRGEVDVDHRSDIYSLGATFYHAATGVMPFFGRSAQEVLMKHLTQAPRPPQEILPTIHPSASAIMLRMLAKNREDRYQTYAELISDLRDLAALVQPSSSAQLPTAQGSEGGKAQRSSSGIWSSLSGLLSRGSKKEGKS